MRRVFVFIIALLTALSGCAVNKAREPVSETRILLDTFCTITVYGKHSASLVDEALDLCAEYEKLFSMTLEESDVWRVNHANGAPVTVSPQTAELIRAGLEFGEISGGMFDITVGKLSTLWDFSGNPRVPSATELEDARASVDYRQVIIDGNSVRLLNPEAWIDLGGIAKGYIADRLADFLEGGGVDGAVIDLGGDVSVVGAKTDGSLWSIGVRKPFGGRNDLLGIVNTGEASIVTSGTYEREFVENGILYHHILDPFTGMPARSDVTGATVLAESAAAGDALSTITLLIGSEKAEDLLINTQGFIGALLILENGELLQLGDIGFEAFN